MNRKVLTFPLVRQPSDDGEYEVTITTADADRMDDIIIPTGGRFEAWQRAGGPVLFAHRRDALPVGQGLRLTPTANGIRMAFRFLADDEFAQRAENAWRQGALGAASIGFMPIRSSPRPEGRGFTFEEWELIEVSLTATPANAAAVRTLQTLSLPIAEPAAAPVVVDEPTTIMLDDEVARDDDPLINIRRSELMSAIFDAVHPLELLVRQHMAAARPAPPDGETFRVDLHDLQSMVQRAVHEEISATVGRETRSALNKLRGRLDD